jgi:hypothetical protein
MDQRPPRFDIGIQRGDSFGDDWFIEVPDFSDEGGPASLDEPGVTVRAMVRQNPDATEIWAEFDCITLDAEQRFVRPWLSPAQTAAIPRDGSWDIEVEQLKEDPERDFCRTFLAGQALLGKDTARLNA